MEVFALRQHLESKNGQILQIKHIEAIEIYKTDHHTKGCFFSTIIYAILAMHSLNNCKKVFSTKRSSKTCPTKTIIHFPIMRLSPLSQFFVA